MNTELSLKLKALTLALMMNGLVLGGTAYLFDGKLHHGTATSLVARTLDAGASHATVRAFRP